MTAPHLPRDGNNNSIPVMRLKTGGAQQIAASAASARNVIAFAADTCAITVHSSVAVYVAFGTSLVTATAADHYLAPGIPYDIALNNGMDDVITHMAVLRVSADGTVYVSERV